MHCGRVDDELQPVCGSTITSGVKVRALFWLPCTMNHTEAAFVGTGVASIKNSFQKRADLDAFWDADIDFARGKLGLQSPARGTMGQTTTYYDGANIGSKLPEEQQETGKGGASWLDPARTGSQWDFQAVSCSVLRQRLWQRSSMER
jgi:hypothetical protein